jgi:hypothetical protein
MECVQLHEALVVGRAAESLPHISPCHAIASINSEREGTSVTFKCIRSLKIPLELARTTGLTCM